MGELYEGGLAYTMGQIEVHSAAVLPVRQLLLLLLLLLLLKKLLLFMEMLDWVVPEPFSLEQFYMPPTDGRSCSYKSKLARNIYIHT